MMEQEHALWIVCFTCFCLLIESSLELSTSTSQLENDSDANKLNKASVSDTFSSRSDSPEISQMRNRRSNSVSRDSEAFKGTFKDDATLGSVFKFNDQIMNNLLESQAPSYARSHFIFNLLRPLDRRTTRYNSWDDHSVMHFGKRSIPETNDEPYNPKEEENNAPNQPTNSETLNDYNKEESKRSSDSWTAHNVMHFGKREANADHEAEVAKKSEDPWHSMMSFGKKSDSLWDHSTMHFGKKWNDPWHSVMNFGKRLENLGDPSTMHFGKKDDDPWHNMMSFGKKSDNPLNDHSTMHFGKRDDPWHSMMSFGKKSGNPFGDHSTMHFGKRNEPWHNMMSFGKKSENPFGDHSTMHFGKRDDPWHSMMSFGKKSENPFGDHSTMHFGKRDDPWHSMMSFGKRDDPWHSMMSFGKRDDPWHSMMSFGKKSENPWSHNTMHFGKKNDDPWHSMMSFGKKSDSLYDHNTLHFGKKADTWDNHNTMHFGKRSNESQLETDLNSNLSTRTAKYVDKRSVGSIKEDNIIHLDRKNSWEDHNTMHFGKKYDNSLPGTAMQLEKKADIWDSHNTMHFGKKSEPWDDHNTMHFGKKSDPWDNHNTMHFGKKSEAWNDHNTMHFGKKSIPWDNHNTMHFGKKSDSWDDHNTMHFGKKSDMWDNHNTMHFGKRSDMWENHNTMHFGKKSEPLYDEDAMISNKKSDPWESHNTMHFGKKSDSLDAHNTMHFGKKSEPWENHNTMHFGKKSDPWESHNTMHFGKKSDRWDDHNTMHFGKKSDLWDSHNTMHFEKRYSDESEDININSEKLTNGKNMSTNATNIRINEKQKASSENINIPSGGLSLQKRSVEIFSQRKLLATPTVLSKSTEHFNEESQGNSITLSGEHSLQSVSNGEKGSSASSAMSEVLNKFDTESNPKKVSRINKNRGSKNFEKGAGGLALKVPHNTNRKKSERESKQENFSKANKIPGATNEYNEVDRTPNQSSLSGKATHRNDGKNKSVIRLVRSALFKSEREDSDSYSESSKNEETLDPVLHLGKSSTDSDFAEVNKRLTNPWDTHSLMHFGKRISDPWESHNTLHFGKKSDIWDNHGTLHFGKKYDPWESHGTLHFGKRSNPWEHHNTLHFAKKIDPWEEHNTLHFGKKSYPWENHNTMHFGKRMDPGEEHSKFYKRSEMNRYHDVLHFGKRNIETETQSDLDALSEANDREIFDAIIVRLDGIKIKDTLKLLEELKDYAIMFKGFGGLYKKFQAFEDILREILKKLKAVLLKLNHENYILNEIGELRMSSDFLKSLFESNLIGMQTSSFGNFNNRFSNVGEIPESDDYFKDSTETDREAEVQFNILKAVYRLLIENAGLKNAETFSDNSQEDSKSGGSSVSSSYGSEQTDDSSSSDVKGKRFWIPFQGPKSIVYPHAWLASQIRRSVLPKTAEANRSFETRMAEKKEDPVNSFMHFGRR